MLGCIVLYHLTLFWEVFESVKSPCAILSYRSQHFSLQALVIKSSLSDEMLSLKDPFIFRSFLWQLVEINKIWHRSEFLDNLHLVISSKRILKCPKKNTYCIITVLQEDFLPFRLSIYHCVPTFWANAIVNIFEIRNDK